MVQPRAMVYRQTTRTLLVASEEGVGGVGLERPLAPGQRSRLRVGDALRIGPALLSVQRSAGVSGERAAARPQPRGAVLVDPAMHALFELVGRAAQRDMTVLILGETGVGKELIAETVHERSPRARRRFFALNCAALPENLIESELFGHERGAFTGAHAARAGLLEECEGGTLFLDEIGELPLGTQAKLLRVLEDRSVMRLGGKRGRRIDVRFVAATNRDLGSEVQRGRFRSDVYHRISGLVVRVPPLRERTSEIVPLARHFLQQLSAARSEAAPELTEPALAALAQHSWPGNVRELRNVIERSALLADGGPIGAEHILVERPPLPVPDADVEEPTRVDAVPHPPTPRTVPDERARLIEALESCGGNQRRAAELLGVSRRTLVNRLDKWELPRPKKAKGRAR